MGDDLQLDAGGGHVVGIGLLLMRLGGAEHLVDGAQVRDHPLIDVEVFAERAIAPGGQGIVPGRGAGRQGLGLDCRAGIAGRQGKSEGESRQWHSFNSFWRLDRAWRAESPASGGLDLDCVAGGHVKAEATGEHL